MVSLDCNELNWYILLVQLQEMNDKIMLRFVLFHNPIIVRNKNI